jgi:hypothetical protein
VRWSLVLQALKGIYGLNCVFQNYFMDTFGPASLTPGNLGGAPTLTTNAPQSNTFRRTAAGASCQHNPCGSLGWWWRALTPPPFGEPIGQLGLQRGGRGAGWSGRHGRWPSLLSVVVVRPTLGGWRSLSSASPLLASNHGADGVGSAADPWPWGRFKVGAGQVWWSSQGRSSVRHAAARSGACCVVLGRCVCTNSAFFLVQYVINTLLKKIFLQMLIVGKYLPHKVI